MSFTFGSLFAGIGGIDLGLERAGMECRWQVEINDYANKVLEKHWPAVPRFRDVREVGKRNLESVDLICGGFPCQDISNAGKRAGIEGERSGLWTEFARIVCELRPRFVLVENVGAISVRGIGRVLSDLSEAGFNAEWETLSACAFGAPHTRQRLFVVAYSNCSQGRKQQRWLQFKESGDSERNIYFWRNQSEPLRVAYGVPNRVDRLRGLGNAVVPQVAQWIGQRIMQSVF